MEIADTVSSILAHKRFGEVWSATPEQTVFEAITLMSGKNIGALPVMEDGELVGIISERDYMNKVVLKGRSSKETAVGEIMTSEVVTVNPSANVVACLQMMTDKSIRHLPVLEDGRLIGIVSIGDLVRRIISAQGALISQLEGYVMGASPI
jgi:CBS domain-containing protein